MAMDTTKPCTLRAMDERDDRLLAPGRGALTVGIFLTITLFAFEALAVATTLPVTVPEVVGGHGGLVEPPQKKKLTPPATLRWPKCTCATAGGPDRFS